MSTDAAAGKKVILKSSDGETFEVPEVVALESQRIKHVIEDVCADHSAIPLPNVSGKILSKVLEYCKKHVEAPKAEDRVFSGTVDEDLKLWDAEFVKVDQNTLFDLIFCADYLNIKSLLDLTCQTVLDMTKGKTPEDIRKIFNVKSEDYLNIKSLLDLTCQTVADMIKGTTPEEIRKTFNIKVGELLKSADHLNMKSLLDLTCQTVADMIKGTTPEEIRKTFNIKSEDYLNIKSLLDLTCQTVADLINGKTPEEIWKTFNIKIALVILKSSDGEIFVVDEVVAWELEAIRQMIVDYCVATAIPFPIRHVIVDYFADTAIPLPNVSEKIHLKGIEFPNVSGKIPLKVIEFPNVSGKILSMVIAYCKKHVEAPKAEDRVSSGTVDEDLRLWDAEFVKVDQNTLFDLILAAKYLNIKSLLDLTCQTVADMIKGKSPEEIRKTFNIRIELSPEDEEEVRRGNQWAFE